MAVGAHRPQANFGDIMQGASGDVAIPHRLQEACSGTDWMQGDPYLRVVLTSNANMQRVMSAWYRDAISVRVCFNNEVKEEKAWGEEGIKQYDRRVEISCFDQVFCVATSRVTLTNAKAVEAVEGKGVGIAQLFHHFQILPSFYLTDAGGRGAQGQQRLWREYVLTGGGIECRIREDFREQFLAMKSVDTAGEERLAKVARTTSSPHLGDLLGMKGTTCLNTHKDIPANAHPLQRVLMTAAGNVVRLITSYHNKPVFVGVQRSSLVPEADNIYEREISIFCGVHCVCRGRSRVTITDNEILKTVKEGVCDLSGIFRQHNLLPKFDLIRIEMAQRDVPGFGRHYTMKAEGVTYEIKEEYSDMVLHLSDSTAPEANSFKGIPNIFPGTTTFFP